MLGAELIEAADGRAAIEVPYREDLTQQHGYFHGGVVTAIADTACGYAAYTTMPLDSSVLTVEFKINLMNPAAGDRLRAEARVNKSGRTLVVVGATVTVIRGKGGPMRRDARHLYRPSNTSDVEQRVQT